MRDACDSTVKLVPLTALPPGVVTLIAPLVAPAGTTALIWVAETTVKEAAVPLKATRDAPVKLAPVIATAPPAAADVGVKPVMAGAGEVTVKVAVVLTADPSPLATAT